MVNSMYIKAQMIVKAELLAGEDNRTLAITLPGGIEKIISVELV